LAGPEEIMSVDNRQSHRKELRVPAVLTIDGSDPLMTHTMDIGKFGMGLIGVPAALKSGLQGSLAFDLFRDGGIQKICVHVRIAYCLSEEAGFRIGVQFTDLVSPGAIAIAHYVDD
jgi:hypothetical protein